MASDWLGANEFGQLGDGTETGRKHPKKVKLLQNEFVISVSCGAHCTAAIAEPRENDGSVSTRRLWVWGQNQVAILFNSKHGSHHYQVNNISYVSIFNAYYFIPFYLFRDLIILVYFGERFLLIR